MKLLLEKLLDILEVFCGSVIGEAVRRKKISVRVKK